MEGRSADGGVVAGVLGRSETSVGATGVSSEVVSITEGWSVLVIALGVGAGGKIGSGCAGKFWSRARVTREARWVTVAGSGIGSTMSSLSS